MCEKGYREADERANIGGVSETRVGTEPHAKKYIAKCSCMIFFILGNWGCHRQQKPLQPGI